MPVPNPKVNPRDKIRTFSQLIEYILRHLGRPVNKPIIHEEQVADAIGDAIDLFQDYSSFGQEHVLLRIPLEEQVTKYKVPVNTLSVVQLLDFRTEYDPEDLFSAQNQVFFSVGNMFSQGLDLISYDMARSYLELIKIKFTPHISFRHNRRESIITITPTPQENFDVGVEAYIEIDAGVLYGHWWIREYTIALSKLQIGINLSKWTNITMPSGSQLDPSYWTTQGQADKERLFETLVRDLQEPPDFFMG